MKTVAPEVFKGGWDNVQNAELLETFSLISITWTSIRWKPDNSKFYIVDASDSKIREYTTVTPGVLTGATFTNVSPVFTSLESSIQSIWWKRDGTILYMIGDSSRIVFQLNASIPYDVTTLVDSGFSFNPSESINPTGIFFIDDMTYYISSVFADDMIFQYEILGPNISTSVFVGQKNIVSETTSVRDVFFNPNGRLMYIIAANEKKIFIYRLSILKSVQSAVLIDELTLADIVETQYRGIFISQTDGNKLYTIKNTANEIDAYDISQITNNALITNDGDELTDNDGNILVHN